MSSSPQKPQYQPSWAFEGRVQQVADEYERRLGRLPVWLHELDMERIVPLLAGCIRIGMQLPSGDALKGYDPD